MAPFGSSSDRGKGGLRRSGDDAFRLTVDYVKQETFAPLKGLGRFLLWGIAGSVAIAIGLLLLLVGVLRLLQERDRHGVDGKLVLGALLRGQRCRARPWPAWPPGASRPGRPSASCPREARRHARDGAAR